MPFVAHVVISDRRMPSPAPAMLPRETGAGDDSAIGRVQSSRDGGGAGVEDRTGVRAMPAEWTVTIELPRLSTWPNFDAWVIRVLGAVVAASLVVLLVSIAPVLI